MLVCGICAALLAIYVNTIYGMIVLCYDVVYVMVSPQLMIALHYKVCWPGNKAVKNQQQYLHHSSNGYSGQGGGS